MTKQTLPNKFSNDSKYISTKRFPIWPLQRLTAKAGSKAKHAERQTTGQQLKLAGNKDQFLFNAELQTSIEDSTELLHQQDVQGALQMLETAQPFLCTISRVGKCSHVA